MMYALPAPAAAGPFEPGARLSGQRELADSARLSPISGRDITAKRRQGPRDRPFDGIPSGTAVAERTGAEQWTFPETPVGLGA